MAIDALALINSQEQRIGELETRLRYLLQSKTIQEYDEVDIHTKEYVKDIHSLDANIEHLTEWNKILTEENDRLKLDVEVCGAELSRYTENIVQMAKQDRFDIVRKVADLLWQGESEKLNISVGGKYYDKHEFIDQIAKEMLEGEK